MQNEVSDTMRQNTYAILFPHIKNTLRVEDGDKHLTALYNDLTSEKQEKQEKAFNYVLGMFKKIISHAPAKEEVGRILAAIEDSEEFRAMIWEATKQILEEVLGFDDDI